MDERTAERLASDLERLGGNWLSAHPTIPWRLIKGMRNRIARTYWTIDDDLVWEVVEQSSPELRRVLATDIEAAHALADRHAVEAGTPRGGTSR